ncbi:MAG: hypothetical protein WBD27_13520 [Pyrinomonadaceae bacterium]
MNTTNTGANFIRIDFFEYGRSAQCVPIRFAAIRDSPTWSAASDCRSTLRLVVIENGEHLGKAGDGQFLKRGECVKI